MLGAAIFLATLASVMIRPFKVSEALSAAVGAVLMLLAGLVRLDEAAALLLRQWNIFGYLFGLMAISALADEAGVFQALAGAAARWGRGGAARLSSPYS